MIRPNARRRIGTSGLEVTEIGFGSAPLGNLYAPVAGDAADAALASALAIGIGLFDTAPYYGFGLAERRLGDAVRGQDVVVASKVGRLLDPAPSVRDDRERHGFRSAMPFEPRFDYSGDGILRSLEASLQRLGLARIDILHVHDIGRQTHGADHERHMAALLDGGFAALERLRTEGAIAAIGIGVNEVAICETLLGRAPLDVILLAGRYTLLDQSGLALLDRCTQAGVSVIIGGPYNSGILAAATDLEAQHYDYAAPPSAIVERARRLAAICARYQVPLRAAALQFPLAHPAVASVIPGLASKAHVADTIAQHARAIPAALWDELVTERLIVAGAPLPC